ncbi:MAG: TspO protein [Candidatus Magasanikbacteria bacterium RIFOXYC2_FULL_40_16]|uniref:TspO protein n=1 Tax=Candidatus Magasanikbacteria bacterium RIFOXYC2_FULL_40_16 TaxID=1798703 RepID=A0A1F6NZU0_9BACT|nr:MAG: TspO protein [Candidatus Magasanikbacteria bacterium RIFOXYA2_FULL_40_20]OGH85293.1 MAG: TspO protein [Candidatus Magasanikbacteria bacterium RIFOXYB2_FULL_40_13]OGH89401.1 MAG: TspO protein [Candidatus Magasanikbacteria bacterium RIFOXYC2_FULL_40_16]
MNEMIQYAEYIKPFWAPPAWVFGPVWMVLYALVAFSFGKVFYLAWKKQVSMIVALPFLFNLLFNFVFTPIQFGLQNNLLAAMDILLVLSTLVWAMKAIWPYRRWIVYVNIPYLMWVSFAAVLQFTVTYLNW